MEDIRTSEYNGPKEVWKVDDLYEIAKACGLLTSKNQNILLITLDNQRYVTGIFNVWQGRELAWNTDWPLEDNKGIIDKAKEMGAADIAFIINHPDGNHWPSEPEMQGVRSIYYEALEHDIFTVDVAMVGNLEYPKNHCSLKAHGIFDDDFDED